jgi:AcrR family transcriptional regulator
MAKKTSSALPSARERLLTAANELFYDEGVHTVGIDRVIERAGVAKASLYSTFGSKDELVGAYLSERRKAREGRILGKLSSPRFATARERLLGVFDVLAEHIAEPGFRGCAFVRASAEARAGSVVQSVCEGSRAWTRSLFTRLAGEAGALDPERLAQQLVLLYDGAIVAAQMDRDRTAAAAARSVAETLLDAAGTVTAKRRTARRA